jgi:hypothetical protein
MEKKDIYEHLAKIYLDASLKRKQKTKERTKVFRNLFFVSMALIFALSAFLLINFRRNKPLKSEFALILQPDAVKINFHFDPARKETYTIPLNKLDLAKYKVLGFAAKKANYKDNTALRVEFVNAFKERSEVYFKNIANRWKDCQVSLSEFKKITNWSDMSSLTFTVEEWNTREKKGIVYIENVRLLK